jgi:hypothetical protein
MDNLNNKTSINYSGNIKLTTYIGNKVYEQKCYHNKGALALYRFLANCLADNFPAAYHLRPFQIRLLSYADADDANAPPAGFRVNPATLNRITPVTTFINLSAAPEITYRTSDNTCGCSVSFSFMFPYDSLGTTDKGANIVAIYGPGISDSAIGDFCAYYLLTRTMNTTDADGNNTTVEVWDPIIKDKDEEETNKIFAVEWTMNLNNKIETAR